MPQIVGYVDICTPSLIAGWAWDSENPQRRLKLAITIEGKRVATVTADGLREDLRWAGIGDGHYCFAYVPAVAMTLASPADVYVDKTEHRLQRSETGPSLWEQLTRFVTKEKRGFEIGPYVNPLAPKRLGYNCLSIDIADQETLIERARADNNPGTGLRVANIEPVDFIGSADQIAELAPQNSFDYALSGHSFEHLPNPIRFLRGCEQVLARRGYLSMAVPDRRTCFDYFRPHTILADFLEAFFANHVRPTAKQVFMQNATPIRYVRQNQAQTAFLLTDDPRYIQLMPTLRQAYSQWLNFEAAPDNHYRDVHCWTFTPASLALLMAQLRFIGLVTLETVDIYSTGEDIHIHLQKPDGIVPRTEEEQFAELERLLHQTAIEAGSVRNAG